MDDSSTYLHARSADADIQGRTRYRPWSPTARFVFRLAVSALILLLITVYSVFIIVPFIGLRLESWIDVLWQWPVHWSALHIFHLHGIAAEAHASDSRDTALNWIAAACIIPEALLAAVLWSVLDRQRKDYRRIAIWLRFVFRLVLIFLMFRYALMKIFPLQMPSPSLAVLNEPLGDTSPMTLLWTLIGLHPGYEIMAGILELSAAVLLCFRRTALIGALLTVIIMTNVLLYNMFFDVPVKLGAATVLLLAIALILPDVSSLYTLFWRHSQAIMDTLWAPPFARRVGRWTTRAAEIGLVLIALTRFFPAFWGGWREVQANESHPSPLTGEWRVDSTLRMVDGRLVETPILTGEGLPMTAIYMEPDGRVSARSADGMLWRAQADVDFARHTYTLGSGYFDGQRFDATYRMAQPDAMHLVLTPIGDAAGANGVVHLTRVPLPQSYPLLERKFHWVNEWALER